MCRNMYTMYVLHLAANERTNEIIICNNRSIINYKSGNKLLAKPMILSKYANNHKPNEYQQYLHTASYKMKTNIRGSITVPESMPSQSKMDLLGERCEWIKGNSANHAIWWFNPKQNDVCADRRLATAKSWKLCTLAAVP